jgi:hypothetical protein
MSDDKIETLFDIELKEEPSDEVYLDNLHFAITENYHLLLSTSFRIKTQKITFINKHNYQLLPLKKHNIIILDWDDTLFPTSYIRNQDVSSHDIDKIKIMENLIIKLIKKLQKLGKVYIITNASYIWFFYTAQIFYPRLFNLKNLKIVSARDHYNQYDTMFWKIFCINHLFSHVVTNKENLVNLVCIGDSFDEHNACDQLFKITQHGSLKKIRFSSLPTITQLETELENTLKIIIHFFDFFSSIDIQVEKYTSYLYI